MSTWPRPLLVRGRPLAGGAVPAVCIPLVGRTEDALAAEAQAARGKQPDLLEWRVDFFEGVADPARVAAVAGRLRAEAKLPLLFTRRSPAEGGQPSTLADEAVAGVYRAVCESGQVDLVDCELASAPALLGAVRQAARQAGIGLLLSFHDFQRTPPVGELLGRFEAMAAAGADVAKIAVMPQSRADVLAPLQATLQASERLPIPVAGMAMGPLGAVSRVCAGEFGSALTFAVGQAASAPGQLPIEALRAALDVLKSVR